jgi:hypothetical protein
MRTRNLAQPFCEHVWCHLRLVGKKGFGNHASQTAKGRCGELERILD